ncbi:MAG: hypothetical protein J1F38_00075 [Muribaculaceae bacterium]|nr:hypothetical protein [Muribaculaceae bacterium]
MTLSENPFGAYIALHSDISGYYDRMVGQVNLFPVTLTLTGADNSFYNGLAKSALNSEIDGAVDGFGKVYGDLSSQRVDSLLKEFEISDLIIRGNYFKNRLNP